MKGLAEAPAYSRLCVHELAVGSQSYPGKSDQRAPSQIPDVISRL